ncbi:MAG: hypothetical protein SOZ02_00235 [Hallerella porci]|uniref:Uncharacterized protein n=1 Tax=Hallerella porci TaxID=1945871 RepID=A0ABX5LIA9_9BACT|nr:MULTISPECIES: hypothetical protein [Hallerella]MCI5601728.1 hypothetical protein [Hallerella sp.]MDY3920575.1 hypothetical protein [Hallerella porci]PWK93237.1 hypothetical protein B0H50_1295 [Hallerella porci]
MEKEISIICRVLLSDASLPLSVENASDEILVEKCKKISEEYQAKAMICRDEENYGVANVYNGGSDFEVISENCFLVICENGKLITAEHSDCWNEKVSAFLK